MRDYKERCPRPATEGIEKNTGERSQTILPTATDNGTHLHAAEADATQTPCRRCGHLLTAPTSLRRGIGPVCRHLELNDERAGGAA